jgi:hypothetical protein
LLVTDGLVPEAMNTIIPATGVGIAAVLAASFAYDVN